MQKIAEGYFYDVYELGNSRVLKRARSFSLVAKSIRGNTGMSILSSWVKAYFQIAECKRVTGQIKRMAPLIPQELFGNPIFNGGVEYEQDRVTLLTDYFMDHSLEENKLVVDKYGELIKELFRYGIHDYVYKFKNSYGVNRKGRVVFTDFNEVTFSKEKVASLIKSQCWRTEAQLRKFEAGELKDYIGSRLGEVLTLQTMNDLWGVKLGI